MQRICTLLLFLCLFFAFTSSRAQVSRSSFEIGAGLPMIISDIPIDGGYSLGAAYHFGITSHLGIKPFLFYGKANGDKGGGGLTYTNRFLHTGAKLTFNLEKITGLRELTPRLNLWLNIGAGAIKNKLTTIYDTSYFIESNTRNIDFDQWVYAFTMGISANYYLSKNIDVIAGFDINLTQAKFLTGYEKSTATGYFLNDALEMLYVGIAIKPWAFEDKQLVQWSHIKPVVAEQAGPGIEELLFMDADKDGVPDRIDQDPTTPFGIRVDTKGIAIDTDYDGIPDYLDKCPMVKADRMAKGCPLDSATTPEQLREDLSRDSDDDGVLDIVDKDNATPPGVKVDTKGVELDTDNDGVADSKDACPLAPGLMDNNGCPNSQKFHIEKQHLPKN
jgi:hypothetical protein